MAKKRRFFLRVLKIVLACLFLIIAPLIIFWARGYWWNPQTGTLQKTGTLMIKSTPSEDLKIYLNDQLQEKNRTPLKLTNLEPGNYKVRIEKEGYWPWEKEVTIKEEKITWLEYIILFPKDFTQEKLVDQIKTFKLSPRQEKIAYQDSQNNLALFDLNTQKSEIIYNNLNLSEILWDYQEESLGLKIDNHFYVLELASQKLIKLEPEISLKEIAFNPLSSRKIIGLDQNQNLLEFNLSNQEIKIIKEKVINFSLNLRNLFILTKENNKMVLQESDLNYSDWSKIVEIEAESGQIIPSKDSKRLALLTQPQNILWIIEDNNLEKIAEKVDQAKWDFKAQKLLFKIGGEIYCYTLERDGLMIKEKTLINRFAQEIKQLFWYPDSEHILFVLDNNLFVCDLDGGYLNKIKEKINPQLLCEIPKDEDFLLVGIEDTQQSTTHLLKINLPKRKSSFFFLDFYR